MLIMLDIVSPNKFMSSGSMSSPPPPPPPPPPPAVTSLESLSRRFSTNPGTSVTTVAPGLGKAGSQKIPLGSQTGMKN
jgi:hypothetical protein